MQRDAKRDSDMLYASRDRVRQAGGMERGMLGCRVDKRKRRKRLRDWDRGRACVPKAPAAVRAKFSITITITKLTNGRFAGRGALHGYASFYLSLPKLKEATPRFFPVPAFLLSFTLKKQRFEKINALVFCSSTSRKS